MKHPLPIGLLCVLTLVISSCALLPQRSNTGWGLYPETGNTQDVVIRSRIRIYITDPTVDQAFGTRSIQDELQRLTRLEVLRRGYQLAVSEGDADYKLELHAVEREFTQGWQNRRSISIEAALWHYSDQQGGLKKELVAIGRAALVGQGSLSSSLELETLLRRALDQVLNRALQK